MKIRKHVFVQDICIFCGGMEFTAIQRMYSNRNLVVPQTDERTCIEREDGVSQHDLRPEPARRVAAADDVDTIAERIQALNKQRLEELNKPTEQTNVEDAALLAQAELDYDPYCG